MSSKHRSCRSSHGFTLIEVLLAVAILGIMATFVFVSLSATTSAIESVREDSARDQMIRSCLTVLTQDLTLSRSVNTSPWFGQNQVLAGQPADSLAFVTGNHRALFGQARQSDQARVVYTRLGSRLIRYVRPNLLGSTEEGIERTELLDDLLGFNVRYFDGQAKVWVDRWDGRTQKQLPKAFMIELTFDQGPLTLPKVYTAWLTLPT